MRAHRVLRRLAGVIVLILVAPAPPQALAADGEDADQSVLLRPWQETAVREALQDPDVRVRHDAVKWLSEERAQLQDKALAAQLLRYTRTDAPEVFRVAAWQVLWRMGPAGAALAPQVALSLTDPDAHQRVSALRVLASIGPAAAACAPQVAARLQDTDGLVRDYAVYVLAELGPAALPFAPQIAARLSDDDSRVGGLAAGVLGGMGAAGGSAARQLAERLKDPDEGVRNRAVWELGRMGAAAAAFAPQVAALLRDADRNVRGNAAATLQELGSAGAAFAPQVAALLKDPVQAVRDRALGVLAGMGPAGAVFAPQVAELLKDRSFSVPRGSLDPDLIESLKGRSFAAAVSALGKMGTAGAAFAPQVGALLARADGPDSKRPGDSRLQIAVAQALGEMGAAGAVFAPQVAALLEELDSEVRVAAAQALGAMGAAGAVFAPKVAALLTDDDVRAAAAGVLRRMGSAAPKVAAQLEDRDARVRAVAARALGGMGEAAAAFAPQLAAHLQDSDVAVRADVADALSAVGSAGAMFAPQVATLLTVSGRPPCVAAVALGRMGSAGAAFARPVAGLLRNTDLRYCAAYALGRMGAAAAIFAPQVGALLKDVDARDGYTVVRALLAMGPAGTAFAPEVAARLQDAQAEVRGMATWALDQMARARSRPDRAVLLHLLDSSHLWRAESPGFLLRGYFYRGTPEDLILIRWLGNREPAGRPWAAGGSGSLDRAHAREVLEAFNNAWGDAKDHPRLRDEMASRVAELARLPVWQWRQDTRLLTGLKAHFAAAGLTDQESALRAVLGRWSMYQRAQQTFLVIGAHLAAWLVLIFAYPRSAWVQGLFFWNRWGRRFLGLGYVGALITLVPWLRRRMFVPFRGALLPRGIVEQFSEATYFPDGEVVPETPRRAQLTPVALARVLGRIRGQVVLKGPSGLGKTLVLLRLALRTRQPVVFLRATECRGGVDAAIQRKLQGQLRDGRYLAALIYAGGLKVLIDGVNESSPEARVAITEFVEKYFKGDIILTTQPMSRESWEPPTVVSTYVLQPLRADQIESFLRLQWESVAAAAADGRESYEQAVRAYVGPLRRDGPAGEAADPRLIALTNPMDAVLAAELLARGETPDMFRLVEQRHRVMAQAFRETQGRDFPLRRFSEAVYEWRRSGEPHLGTEGLEAEVAALAAERLMIRRTEVVVTAEGEKRLNRWFFRHDRIMEFFLLPVFLEGRVPSPRHEHIDDESFIGVYELLAVHLPDDEERELYQRLIDHAADTKSHELLRRYTLARRQRPGAPPPAP